MKGDGAGGGIEPGLRICGRVGSLAGARGPLGAVCRGVGIGGGRYAGGGRSYCGTCRGPGAFGASARGTVISPVSPNSCTDGNGSSSRATGTVIDPASRSGSISSTTTGRTGAAMGGAMRGRGRAATRGAAGVPAAGRGRAAICAKSLPRSKGTVRSPSSSSSASPSSVSAVAPPASACDDIICVASSSSSSASSLIGSSPSRPRARTRAPPTPRSSRRSPRSSRSSDPSPALK